MQNNNDKKDDISKRLEELKKQRREQNNKNNNNNQKPPYSKLPFILGLVLLILVPSGLILVNQLNSSKNITRVIEYNDFLNKIENDRITSIEEKNEFITASVTEGNSEVIYKARKITDRVVEDDSLMGIIEAKNVSLKVQQPTGPNYFWPLLFNLLPFIIIFGVGLGTAAIVIIVCFLLNEQK